MRVLGLGLLLALVASACATDPNGAPDVTASTQLTPRPPEIDPDNEIVRVRARNPSQTKRLTADTRDKSQIPATNDLREAWLDILKRAKLNQHHKISREQLSVREHMSIVLRRLQGRRFVEFHDLFDLHAPSPVIVVTFIALLELARESLLEVTQAEAFAPIYVRLAYQPS